MVKNMLIYVKEFFENSFLFVIINIGVDMEKLNYIETIGSEVREYEVTYDAEELNRFRLELIEKFSRIIHCDYVSHRNPYPDMALNPSEFMNYKETYVGQDPAGNLYRLEYDKIFYPTLVHYIDRVLNNKDVEYFKKIYNLDFDQKNLRCRYLSDRHFVILMYNFERRWCCNVE